jgi:hypothetical protein
MPNKSVIFHIYNVLFHNISTKRNGKLALRRPLNKRDTVQTGEDRARVV